MNAAEDLRHGAVALHAVNHARGGGHIGGAGAAGADEGVEVQQQHQPVQAQRHRQLGEGRAEVQTLPAVGQVRRRQRADEGHLQRHVDHRRQQDGTHHAEGHALARVAGLAGQVDRALEAVEAEHDAAGGHRRHDAGPAKRGKAAGGVAAQIAGMEAAVDQCAHGQRRHDHFEDGDGAVGLGEQAHAPVVEHEVDDDQQRGKHQAGRGQLAVGKQMLGPGVRPGAHVLHRGLGLDRDHRDNGDPVGPAGDEA